MTGWEPHIRHIWKIDHGGVKHPKQAITVPSGWIPIAWPLSQVTTASAEIVCHSNGVQKRKIRKYCITLERCNVQVSHLAKAGRSTLRDHKGQSIEIKYCGI